MKSHPLVRPVLVLGFSLWLLFSCGGPAGRTDPALLAEARQLAANGSHWFNLGCYEKAGRFFHQALENSRLLDDVPGIIRARNNLGAVALALGRLDEAAGHLREALDLCRSVQGSPEESLIYGNLASLAYKAGRVKDAEEFWLKAVSTAETRSDRPGLALHLTNLGALLRRQGRIKEAALLLEQALGEAAGNGDPRGQAGARLELGLLAQADGDLAQAEEHLTLALGLDKEAENPRGIAQDLEQLGRHYQNRKMWDQAAVFLDRAVYLYSSLGRGDKVEELVGLLEANSTAGGRPESLEPYKKLLEKKAVEREDALCR
ncbi:MAG: tetratricopeptide repeat protein [Thermodesulfobacteriota bacterium]